MRKYLFFVVELLTCRRVKLSLGYHYRSSKGRDAQGFHFSCYISVGPRPIFLLLPFKRRLVLEGRALIERYFLSNEAYGAVVINDGHHLLLYDRFERTTG
jgi:hypothetical protein